jgi:lysophospholipase L1-like esterase
MGPRCPLILFALLVTACGTAGTPTPVASPSPSPPAVIYAAIGASETVGIGSTNPRTDAWPTVLARSLPPSTLYRNYGISGETVAGALTDEVPKALIVKPTLVTVWLNVNDITAGVSAADYGDQLTRLVHAMRRGGAARVLVANTPWLDHLPIYVACRTGSLPAGLQCPGRLAALTPDVVNGAVETYNRVIDAVVQGEGAELVDLHAQGEIPVEHPDWVGPDGFHPSTAGHAAVAGAFAAQYARGAANSSSTKVAP